MKTEYEQKVEDFNDFKNTYQPDGKPQSACAQLDKFRETIVALNQTKRTYWPRPCLSDWPCLFFQHRSEIEKIKERLSEPEKRLMRECESEMVIRNGKGLSDAIQNTQSQHQRQNVANNIGPGNITYTETVVNNPSPQRI